MASCKPKEKLYNLQSTFMSVKAKVEDPMEWGHRTVPNQKTGRNP